MYARNKKDINIGTSRTYRVSHNTWDSLYKIRQNEVSVKKNGLEEKKVKFNVKKLHFKRVQTKSEYIRHLEEEKSSPLVVGPFL
jgi:hypothetical protein